jgi:hypothetical protein
MQEQAEYWDRNVESCGCEPAVPYFQPKNGIEMLKAAGVNPQFLTFNLRMGNVESSGCEPAVPYFQPKNGIEMLKAAGANPQFLTFNLRMGSKC